MKSSTPLREITARARFGLSGNWGKSIGVVLVYTLLVSLLSAIPMVGSLVQIILTAPFIVGVYIYFLATARGQENPFGLLFEGFGRFGTALCASLLVILLVGLWCTPLMILVGGLFVLAHPEVSLVSSVVGMSLMMFGFVVFVVGLLWIQMRYSFVLYGVADDPDVRALESVRRGVDLMRGNYVRFFLFSLRFVGWSLLCLVTFGIGFLWLYPYLMASYAAFYLDLKETP